MASPQSGVESDKEINNNNDEQIKTVIEVMASNGQYWHDWDKLRGMLSFYLKQVLSDYPEAKMTVEQQQSCIGESFPELVKRLDNALNSFDEGPPFTLQRLCEILLEARSIYPKLSKLALALEKNLLVTSTLTISSEPYVSSNMDDATEPEKLYMSSNMEDAKELEKPYVSSNMQDATEPEKPYVSSNMQDTAEPESDTKTSQVQSNSVSNGVEPIASAGDADEVMAEVEEAEVEDVMTIDMDTIEAIVRSSEADTTPTSDS